MHAMCCLTGYAPYSMQTCHVRLVENSATPATCNIPLLHTLRCTMTARWLLCLLAVLAIVLQAEGLSRRKRPHPDHDDPASFYYLVRCASDQA